MIKEEAIEIMNNIKKECDKHMSSCKSCPFANTIKSLTLCPFRIFPINWDSNY